MNRGRRIGEQMIGNFSRLGAQLYSINQAYPANAYNTPGLLLVLRPGEVAQPDSLIKAGFAIGDPDDVTTALQMWESTGVDSVTFLLNSSQIIPQEAVLDSLRLFAREVMPRFDRGLNPTVRDSARRDDGVPAIPTTATN